GVMYTKDRQHFFDEPHPFHFVQQHDESILGSTTINWKKIKNSQQ
ncbi:MAG: hypothetical protein ACI90V_012415, partial [Bacillariaceae sp.]